MVKVPRVALRAPWARMQGATPQTGPRRRNPKGEKDLRPLDGVTRHRRCPRIDFFLVPCQRPQIPGARPHATFTTGS